MIFILFKFGGTLQEEWFAGKPSGDYDAVMIDDIYNTDVLRLAANIGRTDRLKNPDATVSLRSPLCGSSIEVDIILSDGNRITDYAHSIKACALGQAAAAVMAVTVIGKTEKEIAAVRKQVEAMLKEENSPPDSEDWSALAALAPAKNAKPRHGAILLPFDAVLQAIDEINSGS
ncbi:MAG: iron-sulfur cluster assembly scaffold protein [Rhodospirillales bacterium]|jgi:NifU-like protein involved in Fe-S cluster formation|nr:iron-sulfur cluster assembly scaffold protein [Rhodospirillales bacterium]